MLEDILIKTNTRQNQTGSRLAAVRSALMPVPICNCLWSHGENFDNSEFEQFIKRNADQYRLILPRRSEGY